MSILFAEFYTFFRFIFAKFAQIIDIEGISFESIRYNKLDEPNLNHLFLLIQLFTCSPMIENKFK